MLLMALPNEHLMTFNQYKDAKTLFAAIKTRFGGNEATKKTQKTLLKQMYENFSATSTESLPSELNTRVVAWRNKTNLDTMSIDDLYNNFKIVEQEVKGTTYTNSNTQNIDFMSSPSPNSTDEVPTDFGVSTASPHVSTANLSNATVYAFLANQPNGSQLVHEDLEQIHEDDLEEIDLKWQLALLNGAFWKRMQSAKEAGEQNQESRNHKKNSECGRHIFQSNGGLEVYTDNTCSKTCLKNYATLKTQYDELRVEFNKSECNLANYKRGLVSVEEQLVHYKKNESLLNENIAVLKRDILIKDSEIVVLKSKLEKISKENDDLDNKIKKFENASQHLDKLIGSQITDKRLLIITLASNIFTPLLSSISGALRRPPANPQPAYPRCHHTSPPIHHRVSTASPPSWLSHTTIIIITIHGCHHRSRTPPRHHPHQLHLHDTPSLRHQPPHHLHQPPPAATFISPLSSPPASRHRLYKHHKGAFGFHQPRTLCVAQWSHFVLRHWLLIITLASNIFTPLLSLISGAAPATSGHLWPTHRRHTPAATTPHHRSTIASPPRHPLSWLSHTSTIIITIHGCYHPNRTPPRHHPRQLHLHNTPSLRHQPPHHLHQPPPGATFISLLSSPLASRHRLYKRHKRAFGLKTTQHDKSQLPGRAVSISICVVLKMYTFANRSSSSSSSKSAPTMPQSMAWTTSDTRYESTGLSKTQELSHVDTLIPHDSLPVNKTNLTQADLKGKAYEVVKEFYPDVNHLQFQMEECYKLLTDQVDETNLKRDQVNLEYLRYGSKGCSLALSISKIKAASYPDFGLEMLMLEQMLIEDVCTYDISAKGVKAEPSVESYRVKPIEVMTQTSSVKISEPVTENNGSPIIEDWESEREDEVESPPEIERKTVKLSMDKARCKYHQRKRMVNGTNHSRVNHSANTVPKAVLTRLGLKPANSVRHMTENISYLTDFKEFDEGYVAFGGGAKGVKIIDKGIIRTAKDNVVQRLKENALRNYCCCFNITAAGSTLMLLDKVDAAAEVLKNLL
nr:ribonuclease H-like domain-containing protein [Tanacetum cinerariifolium]